MTNFNSCRKFRNMERFGGDRNGLEWCALDVSFTLTSSIKGIGKCLHFRFTADLPDVDFVKHMIDTPILWIKLCIRG